MTYRGGGTLTELWLSTALPNNAGDETWSLEGECHTASLSVSYMQIFFLHIFNFCFLVSTWAGGWSRCRAGLIFWAPEQALISVELKSNSSSRLSGTSRYHEVWTALASRGTWPLGWMNWYFNRLSWAGSGESGGNFKAAFIPRDTHTVGCSHVKLPGAELGWGCGVLPGEQHLSGVPLLWEGASGSGATPECWTGSFLQLCWHRDVGLLLVSWGGQPDEQLGSGLSLQSATCAKRDAWRHRQLSDGGRMFHLLPSQLRHTSPGPGAGLAWKESLGAGRKCYGAH